MIMIRSFTLKPSLLVKQMAGNPSTIGVLLLYCAYYI